MVLSHPTIRGQMRAPGSRRYLLLILLQMVGFEKFRPNGQVRR
jgi:hypothetical protein